MYHWSGLFLGRYQDPDLHLLSNLPGQDQDLGQDLPARHGLVVADFYASNVQSTPETGRV